MSFLSPGFAWLFLCLPVIVILYLLRPRHNDHPVPSTLLWQRALAQAVLGNREQAQQEALRYAACAPTFRLLGDCSVPGNMQSAIRSGFAAASLHSLYLMVSPSIPVMVI